MRRCLPISNDSIRTNSDKTTTYDKSHWASGNIMNCIYFFFRINTNELEYTWMSPQFTPYWRTYRIHILYKRWIKYVKVVTDRFAANFSANPIKLIISRTGAHSSLQIRTLDSDINVLIAFRCALSVHDAVCHLLTRPKSKQIFTFGVWHSIEHLNHIYRRTAATHQNYMIRACQRQIANVLIICWMCVCSTVKRSTPYAWCIRKPHAKFRTKKKLLKNISIFLPFRVLPFLFSAIVCLIYEKIKEKVKKKYVNCAKQTLITQVFENIIHYWYFTWKQHTDQFLHVIE